MTPHSAHHERLVHAVLEGELRREAPASVRGRVLARAFPPHRRSANRRFLLPGALAASVAVAAVVWLLLANRYPAATIDGAYVMENGERFQRNAVIRTTDSEARLRLGGYCAVTMSPDTRLKVEGGERTEQVALLQGAVRCKVDRNVGSFDVLTPAGTVSVKGTEFVVRLIPRPANAAGGSGVELGVTVLSGQVLVRHEDEERLLAPGPERIFGAAAPAVLSEDPPSQRLATDENGIVIARGSVVGTVAAKGPGWIEIVSISGMKERYVPVWDRKVPDRIGGYNKPTLAKMAALPVGARVRVRWFVDNHVRITDLETVPFVTTPPVRRP